MPPKTTATAVAAREPTDGRAMDLRRLAAFGEQRDTALGDADAALEAAIDELIRSGPQANISLAARLLGVGRDTLYARLERRREEAT